MSKTTTKKTTDENQTLLNNYARALYAAKSASAEKADLKKKNPVLDVDANVHGKEVTFEVNGVTLTKKLEVKYSREIILVDLEQPRI